MRVCKVVLMVLTIAVVNGFNIDQLLKKAVDDRLRREPSEGFGAVVTEIKSEASSKKHHKGVQTGYDPKQR